MNEMQETNETRSAPQWMAGALVGAALGAGVALLFAPCSGRETRGWLTRKTRDAKHQTSNALE